MIRIIVDRAFEGFTHLNSLMEREGEMSAALKKASADKRG